MNARILGLVGVIAAVVVDGCKDNPTNTLVGTPTRVGFQYATLRVTVADSLATFIVVQDEGSNPVVAPVTVTSCDPATVAVSQVVSGAPLVQTNFFVRGVKYGTACVVGTVDGLSDTMLVATVPDHITISSGPDTVVSGVPASFGFTWVDKQGHPVLGVPAPTWSTSNTALARFSDPVAGTLVGRDTGVSNVIVTEAFSLLGGTVTQTITTNKTIATIPAAFNGTTNSPVPPGGTLVVTANAGGPAYDGTTQIWFGSAAQTTDTTGVPTTVKTPVLDLAAWGPLSMGLKGLGSGEITQTTTISVQVPPLFSGAVSSTTAQPAQLLTMTKGASDSSWGFLARAFFNSTRAWIVDTTSTVAHIALPPAFQTGKTLLLLTRMGPTAVAAQDSLTSSTATAYDQFDKIVSGAVKNSPNSGAHVSTDTTLFISLSGSCTNGGPTVGGSSVNTSANCDDYVAVTNTKATDDTAVTLSVQWQKSAELGVTQDLDTYWFPDTTFIGDATFSEFCVVDGCAGASSANPEKTTVTIPAGQTYYILVNLFNVNGRKYALAKVTIGGLN